MEPLVEKLKGEKFKIELYEVWNNAENAKKMEEYDKGLCGGVPFFFNTDTGENICGSVEYEVLKAWAEGKKA